MAFTKVGSLAALPAGEVLEVEVGGETYAICNVEGDLHAVEGKCPHLGGPLGHGALHGHTLVCPWHTWEYDCRTGRNIMDESVGVAAIDVKVEGDDILIDAA